MYFKNESEKSNLDQTNQETIENSEDAVFVSEEKVKPFSFSKLDKNDSQKSSPSPTSAFSWSKFKFARNNSSDQLPQLDGYKTTSSQFKKVMSESSLEKFFKKKPEEKEVKKEQTEMSYEEFLKRGKTENEDDDGDALVESLESDTVVEEDSGISPPSSADTESYPYSIDSACISQTDLYLDSQKSTSESQNFSSDSQIKTSSERNFQNEQNDVKEWATPNLETSKHDPFIDNSDKSFAISNAAKCKLTTSAGSNAFKMNSKSGNDQKKTSESKPQDIVSIIDSDDDDVAQAISSKNRSISTPKNIKSPTNPSSKSSIKSGCRVSGLRRGSKKQNKMVVDDGKQQNLKDMFSKFAHQKGDQPKLTHNNSVTLEDDKYTPEGCKSSLGAKSGIQKRIL